MPDICFVTGNIKPYNLRETFDSILLATMLDSNNYNVMIENFSEYDDSDYHTFCEKFARKISKSGCKLVIFQTYYPSLIPILRIAEQLKQIAPQINNLFFGEETTNTGPVFLEHIPFIDYIYVGEPENKILDIVNGILKNKKSLEDIYYLYYKDKPLTPYGDKDENIADVNTLPRINTKFLHPSLKKNKGFYLPLNVGRGCPYRCTFCNTCISRSRRYRLMSPERIVEDIKHYVQEGYTNFEITHDSLFANEEKVSTLCDLIKRNNLNINIAASGRIDNVSIPLIDKMLDVGFKKFFFGIETGSPQMQKTINKKLDLQKSFEKIKYIRQKNANVTCYFIFGFPEETEQDLKQTLNYMIDLISIGVEVNIAMCFFATRSQIYDKYYNELQYNNISYDLQKFVLGYNHEKEWVKHNKQIFGFMYNYNTKIREEYKYLNPFNNIFKKYPNTLYYLREVYGKENVLNIYKDLLNSNNNFDGLSVKEIKNLPKNCKAVILKLLESLQENKYYNTLKDIYVFETDLCSINPSGFIIKQYAFNYSLLKQKEEISQIGNFSSSLIIRHTDNGISVKSLL